jgi:hypothetical protein
MIVFIYKWLKNAVFRREWSICEASGKKTPLFAPFDSKNDHFAKTGSGQT